MGETVIADVTAKMAAVEADIVTIGGTIIVLAAVVFGFRWLKAQFF